MFHSAVVSDLTTNPLPPPHPEILKYFDPPQKVLKRARPAIEECKEAFKVKEVPKRVAKAGTSAKKGHEQALEDDEMLLLDRKREKSKVAGDVKPMEIDVKLEPASPEKGKAKAVNLDNSDTEDDEDDEFVTVEPPAEDEGGLLLDQKKPAATPKPSSPRGRLLPTPARSISPQIDPGRAPGRIIGSTYPLKDFEKNIAQGDVVTKAVADLCEVITETVLRPFASRRSKEMIECMKVLRDTCLRVRYSQVWLM